jgi:hypothetical protein
MKEREKIIVPRAREDGLLVEELRGELLIYDLTCDKAHCLNPTAALVWRHCDGQTTVNEMARLLEKSLATTLDEEIVWCALNQLEKDGLLEQAIELPCGGEPITRRALARRLGIATVLLPLVTTIVVPAALAAASCGMACSGGTCPSGCTCCPDNVCRVSC